MVSKTFVIIKPDAISRGLIGRIISRFEDKFLRIVALEQKQKDEIWCRKHYEGIVSSVYCKLEEFMLKSPIIGIVLQGPDAIDTVRRMVGSTNSLKAAPGTIRGDWGTHPIRYNIVHAADSAAAVEHEIKLFFGRNV